MDIKIGDVFHYDGDRLEVHYILYDIKIGRKNILEMNRPLRFFLELKNKDDYDLGYMSAVDYSYEEFTRWLDGNNWRKVIEL